MTVREAKREVSMRVWGEMVKAQQDSGLSIRDWCASQGMSTSTFATRQRKLREYSLEMMQGPMPLAAVSNSGPSINLAKISLPSSNRSASDITIKRNGIEVDINNSVNPELAKYIIGVMLNA